MATRGDWNSLPLAVGVDCGHPQWLDLSLFFFFFFFARKVAREGGGWQCLFVGGERWATLGGGIWVSSHLFGCLIS
jgi:hypothetical protein